MPWRDEAERARVETVDFTPAGCTPRPPGVAPLVVEGGTGPELEPR